MGVSAAVRIEITAVEDLLAAAIPTVSASDTGSSRVTHKAFNLSNVRLNGTTTAKVDAVAFGELETDGADTIDLTAVQTALDAAADMTGKKVVAAIFRCPSTNADPINIAPGASNPYLLFGSGNDVTIPPGMVVALAPEEDVASPFAAVSGSAKTLDVTGTATDVLKFQILLGTP